MQTRSSFEESSACHSRKAGQGAGCGPGCGPGGPPHNLCRCAVGVEFECYWPPFEGTGEAGVTERITGIICGEFNRFGARIVMLPKYDPRARPAGFTETEMVA